MLFSPSQHIRNAAMSPKVSVFLLAMLVIGAGLALFKLVLAPFLPPGATELAIVFDQYGCVQSVTPSRPDNTCTLSGVQYVYCPVKGEKFSWTSEVPFRINFQSFEMPVRRPFGLQRDCRLRSKNSLSNSQDRVVCRAREESKFPGRPFGYHAYAEAHEDRNCSIQPHIIIRD